MVLRSISLKILSPKTLVWETQTWGRNQGWSLIPARLGGLIPYLLSPPQGTRFYFSHVPRLLLSTDPMKFPTTTLTPRVSSLWFTGESLGTPSGPGSSVPQN